MINLKVLIRKLPDPVLYRLLAYKMRWVGEPEVAILDRLVPRDKTAVDIGANRGAYLFWLEKLTDSVIAFEPTPHLCEFLGRVTRKTEVRRFALSSEKGEVEFRVPIRNNAVVEGETSMSTTGSAEGFEQFETFVAVVDLLDNQNLTDVGFVKIDVEGAEEEVLNGGEEFFRSQRPNILIEIEQRHLNRPISEIFDLIIQMGYCGFFLKGGLLSPLEDFELKRDQNVENLHTTYSVGGKNAYINNFIFFSVDKVFDEIGNRI